MGDVQQFFAGQKVFITGGTGFLGSVLVEKLLRSCPGLDTIYVLIRAKRGQCVQDRLKDLFRFKLFSEHSPASLSRVHPVEGDISLPGLGLSEKDRSRVAHDTTVIFHVAATTNFSAHLSQAVSINLLGTERVVQLSHECQKLQALIYVSTAYCNAVVRGHIAEDVYPCWLSPQDVINTVNSLTDQQVEEKQDSILAGHPNTYAFTKHLAEMLLINQRKHIPVGLVRPSVGTIKEPFPGWVDNVMNGGVAFIAGAGKGVFRTVLGDSTKLSDIVPCDIVANLCIAAAWDVAKKGDGVEVYHCTSGLENPITWGEYCELTVEMARQHPCQEVLWYPSAKCRQGYIRNVLFITLFHLFPALFLHVWERYNGKNRPIIRHHQKFIRGMKYVDYFTKRDWHFSTLNTNRLLKKLSPKDRAVFDFDVTHIHWPSYIEQCVLGVRHFYHKEFPSTKSPLMGRLRIVHYAAYAAVFLAPYFLLTSTGFSTIVATIISTLLLAFMVWL